MWDTFTGNLFPVITDEKTFVSKMWPKENSKAARTGFTPSFYTSVSRVVYCVVWRVTWQTTQTSETNGILGCSERWDYTPRWDKIDYVVWEDTRQIIWCDESHGLLYMMNLWADYATLCWPWVVTDLVMVVSTTLSYLKITSYGSSHRSHSIGTERHKNQSFLHEIAVPSKGATRTDNLVLPRLW